MSEIEFSTLRRACCYVDIFIKHKKDKTTEAIYYCDNDDRAFNEPRCERYCEESKCPLLVNNKKSRCDTCVNNDNSLSEECCDCQKGIKDYYVKL